jgi:hypothetical protein
VKYKLVEPRLETKLVERRLESTWVIHVSAKQEKKEAKKEKEEKTKKPPRCK